jgi:hypothetical protein
MPLSLFLTCAVQHTSASEPQPSNTLTMASHLSIILKRSTIHLLTIISASLFLSVYFLRMRLSMPPTSAPKPRSSVVRIEGRFNALALELGLPPLPTDIDFSAHLSRNTQDRSVAGHHAFPPSGRTPRIDLLRRARRSEPLPLHNTAPQVLPPLRFSKDAQADRRPMSIEEIRRAFRKVAEEAESKQPPSRGKRINVEGRSKKRIGNSLKARNSPLP